MYVPSLIGAVHDHPVLWDKDSVLNKDRGEKARAWTAVTKVVYPLYDTWSKADQDWHTQEVTVKWQTVRHNYRHMLKKEEAVAQSGPGGKRPHPYVFTGLSGFLGRTLDPAPGTSEASGRDVVEGAAQPPEDDTAGPLSGPRPTGSHWGQKGYNRETSE